MAVAITKDHRNWRYRIFALTWLSYAGFYLCRKNFAVAKKPLADHFGFTNDQLGTIGFGYLVVYSIGQFVNGFLGDVKGPRFMVGLGLFLSVAMNLLCGFGESVGFFAILLGINGLAQSTGWPGNVKCMGSWFTVRERGLVMGWWCTCYSVGGLVASWYAVRLYMVYYGYLENAAGEAAAMADAWKIVFWGPALTLSLIALAYVLIVRNNPTQVGLPEIVEVDEKEDTSAGGAEQVKVLTKEEERRATFRAIRQVFSSRTVLIYGTAYFVLKFIRYGMLFWLPKYGSDELGYDLESSVLLSLGFEFLGFLGVLFAGYMSDKAFSSRRTPICVFMIAGLVVACLLQSQMAYWGKLWYFLGLCLIGFCLYGPDALMTGAAAQDFGTKRGAAMCSGVINGIGSIGACVQEKAIGWATTEYASAWSWLFYVFAALSLGAAILMAFTWRDVPKSQERQGNAA